VALLVAGAVAASASSLPDSPLYPVKGALEQARGALAFAPSDRLSYHLDLAQTRLTEAEAMIARHRVDLADQALQAMTAQLDDAAGVVTAEGQADPVLAADLANRLQRAIATHTDQLDGIQGELTNPDARAAIERALARAQATLARISAGTSNGNGGTGSGSQGGQNGQDHGQGQGNKGSVTPHPTPKK
jgi:hypothetical protein